MNTGKFFEPEFSFLAGSAHLQLQASTEALTRTRASREETSQPPPVKSPQTVEADARGRVTAEGGNAADRRHILSRMEVQFGQYRGTTFQWLLTHDVGYVSGVLAGHVAEREGGDTSSSPLMLHKDALLEYAHLFPPMAAAIEDKKRAGTDTEADHLVGFGEHSSLTYRELYESTDPEISSYRSWVRSLVVKNGRSRVALLKQYVLRRDREQRSLATSAASAEAGHASTSAAGRASIQALGHDVALAALHASALATGRAGALAAACADALAAACADALAAACADALAAACADALAAACASALAAACASALAAACASVSAAVASTSGSSIPVSRLTPSKSTICGLSDTLEEKEKMDDQQIMEVTAAVEQQVAASMTERPSRPPTARVMLAAPQDEANVGVYGTSGYQQVVCLAHSLVELCVKGYVTDAEAEHLVERWQNLAEVDKQAVSYPPRYRQELAKGRFKKTEVYAPSDTPVAGGLESLKRCVAGTGSGLVQWPDASRLVEAVFIRLTVLHPASKRMMGGTVSRWTLVLRDYNTVRNVVTGHPALGARTTIQLFAVNQATLSQWHKRYTAAQEGRILHAGLSPVQGTLSAQETLLSARQLTDEQRESFRVRDPFHFQDL
ncbi:uncharacterized protein DAT39_023324, partial [Clarias magur]